MSSDPVINSALMRMCAQARTADQPSSPNDNNNNNASSGDGEQRDVILAHDVPQTTRATTTPAAAAAPAVPATRQPEDYAWLRSALAAVEAPERRVRTLLERAEQPARGHDDLVATLDELSDLVEDINWATEFALMHGPRRLVGVWRTSPHVAAHASVRTAAALVMAHSAQLSDALQSRYAEAQWWDVVLPQLRVEDDAACVAALLHACSCLCRGHAGNTVAFVQHGGLDVLATLLRQRLPRLDAPPQQQQQQDEEEGDSRDNHNSNNNNTSSSSSSAATAADKKVVARALFFLRYFAEAGVSSEELIELACQHAERSVDDVVQRAAAGALLQLLRKSPRTVAATMRRVMVTRLHAWRVLRDKCRRGRRGGSQHHGSDNKSSAAAATTCGADDANSDDDDDDARVQLMAALDRTA